MITGLPPYYADDKEELFQNIMNDELVMPDHISANCKDLLTKLLDKDPEKRLGSTKGAEEVKAHVFFDDVNWINVINRSLQPPDPYLV